MLKRSNLVLISTLALLVGAPAQAAPAVKGSCEAATAMNFIASAKDDSFASTGNFEDLPQAAVAFDQGPRGCVVVTFTANVNAEGHAVRLRPLMDGSLTAVPAFIQLSEDTMTTEGRSATFVFPNVAPGPHKIQMQFASEGSAFLVTIGEHITLVHYLK